MSRSRSKPFARASRPRKQAGVMNQTEAKYAEILEMRRAAGQVVAFWYERHTYRLADDTRLTPDFVVLLADGSLEVHEVKGEWVEEDSLVKLKVFADQFPYLVKLAKLRSKKNGGAWEITEMKSLTWSAAA